MVLKINYIHIMTNGVLPNGQYFKINKKMSGLNKKQGSKRPFELFCHACSRSSPAYPQP